MEQNLNLSLQNNYYGFSSDDILSCDDYSRLCDYSIKNMHTITSIEIQMLDYADEDVYAKRKKKKALKLMQLMQHIINIKLKEFEYYETN